VVIPVNKREIGAAVRRVEKARVVFTRAVIAALETGTPLPPEVVIEEVVGGFTVKNENGFFVVTVQKAG
jgi:hypothetical protein